MAVKKSNPSFAFVTKFLKRRPKAPYADVKAAAEKAGHTIYPIVYGRAQALLGIVKSKSRGSGKAVGPKKVAEQKAAPAPVARKRGRPAKAAKAAGSAVGSLDAVLAHIRGIEKERDQMRAALEKIRSVIDNSPLGD